MLERGHLIARHIALKNFERAALEGNTEMDGISGKQIYITARLETLRKELQAELNVPDITLYPELEPSDIEERDDLLGLLKDPSTEPIFGQVIRALREEQGLNQTVFGKRAGLTQSTVSQLEVGSQPRTRWNIGKLTGIMRGLSLPDDASGYIYLKQRFEDALINPNP